MSGCNPFPPIRQLLIQCAPSIRDAYSTVERPLPPEWFQEVDGILYFKIRCQPGEYTENIEGERPRYKRSLGRIQVPVKLVEKGFSVQIPEDDFRFRLIMEAIVAASWSADLMQHYPVVLVDAVRPRAEQYRNALQASSDWIATVKTGSLEVEAGNGLAGVGFGLLGENGIKFNFRERDLSQG